MNFGQGFAMGAATAAVGYMGNCWFHEKFLPWVKKILAGQTIYAGFEGHALVGGGFEAYVSFTEDKIKAQLYLKVCLGDALGDSFGGGIVLNPPEDFWDAYGGPSLEVGYKSFEGALNFSPDTPVSVGYTYGEGGKITPCWYFSLKKTNIAY